MALLRGSVEELLPYLAMAPLIGWLLFSVVFDEESRVLFTLLLLFSVAAAVHVLFAWGLIEVLK